MARETEGTAPPSLRPPGQWVWVEAAEPALGSGAGLQGGCQTCLWLLDLVCGTFSSLTSQVHVPLPLPWTELPAKGSRKVSGPLPWVPLGPGT